MVFRIKNKQNFTNSIEDKRSWPVFFWTSMSERYFRAKISKHFDKYCSDISHWNEAISKNYLSDVPIRGIKIIAPKYPKRWKLLHWWEPSLSVYWPAIFPLVYRSADETTKLAIRPSCDDVILNCKIRSVYSGFPSREIWLLYVL